jgi:hypothetical protein
MPERFNRASSPAWCGCPLKTCGNDGLACGLDSRLRGNDLKSRAFRDMLSVSHAEIEALADPWGRSLKTSATYGHAGPQAAASTYSGSIAKDSKFVQL